MAGNRVKGITIEIGGDTTKLDQALIRLDGSMGRVQRDLKDVEKYLKLDPTNVDLLAQKQRLLAEQTELAGKRLDIMIQAVDQLDDSVSKNQLDKFNLELDLSKAKEKEASDELEQFKKSLNDVSDSTEQVSDGMSNAGESSGKMKDGFTLVKGVAANLASRGISFLADMALKAVDAFWSLDEVTEEFRESVGLLNTAFESAGFNSEVAREAYRGFYEILGDTGAATEASQLLSQLVTNEKEVSKWVEIAAGVYGTFGESLPIESLIEAANETAKTGEVTGALADALNWIGISEEEVNRQLASFGLEASRSNYLMGLLANTFDSASDSFYENNKALIESRNAQADMDESLAILGEAVSELKTQFFETFGPSLKGLALIAAEALEVVSDVIVAIGDSVGWVIDKIGDAVNAFKKLFGIGNSGASSIDVSGEVKQSVLNASESPADSIPLLTDLPHFASGGVFMPNSPMLGVLGDNPREVEVAAPRSTIVGAVLDAMDMRGGSGPAQQTAGPFILEMTMDGTKFGRVFIPYLRSGLTRAGIKLK